MKPGARKFLFFIVLAAAVALIVVGARRSHRVIDQNLDPLAAPSISTISDKKLVEDATFSGVVREGGVMVSTYDRTQAKAKRACPT